MKTSVPSCLRDGFLLSCALLMLCGSALALDRNAFAFTAYKLELRVDPSGQAMTALGTITLRNDSAGPQRDVSLQISSSLDWRLIQFNAKPVQYVSQNYTTDIDHTGAVREAIVTLPTPVAPKGTIELEIGYAGLIPADSTRLTRIGTPADVATRTDWDRISEDFTALRGVGYVVWYPVSIEAARLSNGEVFSALAYWKDRERQSSLQGRICWITDSESRLTVAANGQLLGMGGLAEEANTGCSEYRFTGLDQTVPAFAIGFFDVLSRPNITVYHLKDHAAEAQEYALAAEKTLPFVTEWFGKPRDKVQVIELNEAGAIPFDSGPILYTPLRASERKGLEVAMVHQLVHAALYSPRLWINEGLAHFGQALYRERQEGRSAALRFMRESLPALIATEKDVLTQVVPPQPLSAADDDVYFRTKAMFVWWMLRDMIGDVPLQRALTAYHAADDKDPAYIQRLVRLQVSRDLEWFFDDWVYRDRGLPDFKVSSAFPRALLTGSSVVTVTVENLGDVGAEVVVIARAPGGEVPKRLEVRAKSKAVVRIELPQSPSAVVINDGSVPESDYGNNSLNVARPPAPK